MKQKFKLNHSKQFQLDAIESTIKLFEGQRKLDTSFVDYIDGVSSNKLDLEEKEIYVCQVCGHTIEDEAPDECPVCNAKKETFKKID